MRHGILITVDGMCHGWTWADHSTTFPGEFPVAPGDRLIDLSQHTNAEAQQVIALCVQATEADREALLAGYPQITLADLLAPPTDHEVVCQPGYRRIAHRPSADWHAAEMAARIRANARLAAGESINVVVREEFAHIPEAQRPSRVGRSLPTQRGHAQFPLTPMIRMSAHQTMTDITTVREFPFHKLIVEL